MPGMIAEQLDERLVRPGRRSAAIEHAVGVAVLAGADGRLQRHGPMGTPEGGERRVACRAGWRRPFGRTDRRVQCLVAGVDGVDALVLDEIAVEVDIVL